MTFGSMIRSRFVGLLVGLIGLSVSGLAAVISISPCAFHPWDSDQAGKTWYAYEKELSINYASPEGQYFLAPVYLPNGAAIKKMTIFVTANGDTSGDDVLSVSLNRQNMASGAVETLAYTWTNGMTPSTARKAVVDSSIKYKTVNNSLFSYSLYVHFYQGCHSTVKLHGVKIEY
jgi:hypothetical protein